MFASDEVTRAVDLQGRSYNLLRWVASALGKGFISFNAAHAYASASLAAEAWIQEHYLNIPDGAKPSQADLKDFSGLFCTYLENSFELVRNPGKRLRSPDAHCFCKICSWLVDAPHLKTKTPTAADKKRARKMTLNVIGRLAAENSVTLPQKAAETMADDPKLREKLALCAYAADLFGRMRGIAVGPAALVLWRSFAWLPTGSPKKKFRLSADLILEAERKLSDLVVARA